MASEVVPTTMVACLSFHLGEIEDIALCRDTLEWAFKFWASCKTTLVLVEFALHDLTSSQVAFCGKYLSKMLSTTSWMEDAAATKMMAKGKTAFMLT